MPHLVQRQFENLLKSEIDRREFLAYCGAAVLGILGVSGLIQLLTDSTPRNNQSTPRGYGASVYGGTR